MTQQRKNNPEPWERQPGETLKAFAAFEVYLICERTLPLHSNRSIYAVALKLDRTLATVISWSKKYRWEERAREQINSVPMLLSKTEVLKHDMAQLYWQVPALVKEVFRLREEVEEIKRKIWGTH